ncbi:MAG: hypothetical protein ABW034_19905 [Steroidobacteraceae bacterium]
MFASKYSACIVLGIAALVTGCATTGTTLRSSAERLERSAYDLSDETRDADASGDYRRDARAFAEETRDFRRVVEDRDSDDRDIKKAFGDLSERYHALRDEAEDSSRAETRDDFRDVTEAYLDVEREVGDVRRVASDN